MTITFCTEIMGVFLGFLRQLSVLDLCDVNQSDVFLRSKVCQCSEEKGGDGTMQRLKGHTFDERNPAPVEVGSLPHYLQGFLHPRWLFGISSFNLKSVSWLGLVATLTPCHTCPEKDF